MAPGVRAVATEDPALQPPAQVSAVPALHHMGDTRSPQQGPGHTLHGRSSPHKREGMARDAGQGGKLPLRYGRSARDVCTAADMPAKRLRRVPRHRSSSSGTKKFAANPGRGYKQAEQRALGKFLPTPVPLPRERIMEKDASREFMENLPELEPGKTFCFACHPEVPCFNRCCAELTLPLTPYDVLRLRRHMNNMPSEAFLNDFTRMRAFPDTGFPLPLLRMLEGPGEPCPFVTPGGCSVYENRPGACRFYPLGRGTKMGHEGVDERFFLVREPHCHGFDEGKEWTAQTWLASQELDEYNAANDRYMRLMAMVKATEKPLEPRMATMVILCLYQLDKFRELIEKMGIFRRVEITEERQKAVMESDEATLDFALDWLELVIFGQSEGLNKK